MFRPHRSALRLGWPAPILTLAVLVSACDTATAPETGDSVDPPEVGACRILTPDEVAQPDNDTPVVDCADAHTAETYAVGALPDEFADASYDDPALSVFAYQTCGAKLETFLGGDESLVMRSVLSWAWFRPSERAWDEGARWYRCDVVGGGEQSREYAALPRTAEGVLLGRPDDRWMVCVNGRSVSGATKIPCSAPHNWRAVTTIQLGDEKDPFPGDRLVEVRTQDFCSDSVSAWLNYPIDFDFGYTWFHEDEWNAGNRRSICWAKTNQ